MPEYPAPESTSQPVSSFNAWISAARPRTLPLALSSIFMGSFLAAAGGQFNGLVFGLCVLTTVLLQILSNLANDYGDSVHGADSADREGPSRAVQAGHISAAAMKQAMIIFAALSLVSGIALLLVGVPAEAYGVLAILFLIGIAAIGAAITYTSGKKPYGYIGLGDVSVMIFFGWVGVMGTYFLHSQELNWLLILPATSCGLFSTAVLNVNNIRDLESDRKAGKKSVPVRIGPHNARIYHLALLVFGVLSAFIYVLLTFHSYWQLLFLVTLPLFFYNGKSVWVKYKPSELDPFLKQMALSTLAFVVAFGIGQML
jgi:1,4-dihydroxy-2-naphthoate octaprenyltransferase